MPRRTWYKALNAPAFTTRRPASAGMEAFNVRRSGVPLQGGQAQGIIAALPSGSGTVTTPGTFQTLFTIGPIPPGTYTAQWTVTLSGTVGAPEVNNFRLTQGTPTVPLITLGFSSNAGAVGSYPQTAAAFTVTPGSSNNYLLLRSGGNVPTAGAVYGGTLTVTGPVGITLQIGPQGAGTVWYPAQVTTFTTSGVNDTSTCLVYMGAAGTPVTLMGTLFPGGAGVLAVAFPPLTVGQFVIAIFSNAKVGDVAAVNVTGTMDYLDAAGPL